MKPKVPPPIDGPNREHWSNEHPTGVDFIGAYSGLNQDNDGPRVRYTGSNKRPDYPPYPATVRCRSVVYLWSAC